MTYQPLLNPDPDRWDAFVMAHPDAHILQSADWGKLKSAFGWSSQIVAIGDDKGQLVAGAQVLYHPLPLRLGTMAYIPAGPLFYNDDPNHAANRLLWESIDSAAKSHSAAFARIEPCNYYRARPDLPDQLERAGARPSPQTVQPPRTIVIDLAGGEEAILKRMNQSTRYKAKLGPKKEVDVREVSRADVASFNALMAVTGQRDAFGVHSPEYYQMAFDLFAPSGRCALLIASHAGKDLAGVMVFRAGPNAYYFYGASSNEERNRMPTYIVQWEAIRWAMRHGATCYDLWGIPDEEEATLEAQFENRHDELWGVYGFKRGFGGHVVRSVGAWDKIYNPLLYKAYEAYLRLRRRS